MVLIKSLYYNIVAILGKFSILFAIASCAEGLENIDGHSNHKRPIVVTTIKPLAIIAKAALGDHAKVEFLMNSNQSAHDFTLSISDIQKLNHARAVIMLSDQHEPSIAKSIVNLKSVSIIKILGLPAIHNQRKAPKDGKLDFSDPHVWLDPNKANKIANAIQTEFGLVPTDIITSEHIARLAASLDVVKDRTYLTHHDMLGHFTEAFDLAPGLTLRDSGGKPKGARSQYKLREKANDIKASCLFVDQYYFGQDAILTAVAINVSTKNLDSLGIGVPLSNNGYAYFIDDFVSQFKACFD